MPRSLRTIVELNIHAITCPGVWLPNRNDVYLTVSMFGQHRRTQYYTPIFPVLFHEKFRCDKYFYTAIDPSQVADCMEDYMVYVELIQVSDIYPAGRLLASYESNIRDFLYPYPSYSYSYGSQDRKVLMERTIDFPGIAPELEFSTVTTIREVDSSIALNAEMEQLGSVRSSRRRSRSRQRSPNVNMQRKEEDYQKPTLASIYRSRSPSPSLSRRMEDVSLSDPVDDDTKPPFVVRKVGDDLIARTPGTSVKKPRSSSACGIRPRSRSLSPSRARSSIGTYGSSIDDTLLYTPSRRLKTVLRDPLYDPVYYPYYRDPDFYLDWEYDYTLRRYVPKNRYSRWPYYYDYYPYNSYSTYSPSWRYHYNKYLHELDDIDLELRRSRLRRYYP